MLLFKQERHCWALVHSVVLLPTRHRSPSPAAGLALRGLSRLCGSSLGGLLLLMLPKHLRILVRTRRGRHAIDHASLLLSATSRGIHRSLGNVVPGHLVLHQPLLQMLKRRTVCLFLSNIGVLSPDLVLNLDELRLYLWRELPRLLWHTGRTR